MSRARHRGKLPLMVLSVLKEAKRPMTSIEIAEKINHSTVSGFQVQQTLRRLLEAGVLDVQHIDRKSRNGPQRLWSLRG